VGDTLDFVVEEGRVRFFDAASGERRESGAGATG